MLEGSKPGIARDKGKISVLEGSKPGIARDKGKISVLEGSKPGITIRKDDTTRAPISPFYKRIRSSTARRRERDKGKISVLRVKSLASQSGEMTPQGHHYICL